MNEVLLGSGLKETEQGSRSKGPVCLRPTVSENGFLLAAFTKSWVKEKLYFSLNKAPTWLTHEKAKWPPNKGLSNKEHDENVLEHIELHASLLFCFVFSFSCWDGAVRTNAEHFCFLQIKQSSFCPLESLELLLRQPDLAPYQYPPKAFLWHSSESWALLSCSNISTLPFTDKLCIVKILNNFSLSVLKLICFLNQKRNAFSSLYMSYFAT